MLNNLFGDINDISSSDEEGANDLIPIPGIDNDVPPWDPY